MSGMTPSGVYTAISALGEKLRSEMATDRKERTENLEKVRERLHMLSNAISLQQAEDAKWRGIHEERGKAAHRRIDEVEEDVREVRKDVKAAGGPGTKGWLAIIISAITGACGVAAAYFTGKNG